MIIMMLIIIIIIITIIIIINKTVLKNFAKIHKKTNAPKSLLQYSCWLQDWKIIERKLQQICFPVNFEKFSRIAKRGSFCQSLCDKQKYFSFLPKENSFSFIPISNVQSKTAYLNFSLHLFFFFQILGSKKVEQVFGTFSQKKSFI